MSQLIVDLLRKARLTNALSQTNPVAWQNFPHHWNFTLFYTLWITVELIFVYFVYVETKYVLAAPLTSSKILTPSL